MPVSVAPSRRPLVGLTVPTFFIAAALALTVKWGPPWQLPQPVDPNTAFPWTASPVSTPLAPRYGKEAKASSAVT